jgi:hypothetical protein
VKERLKPCTSTKDFKSLGCCFEDKQAAAQATLVKQKFFNSFYLMNGISKLRKSTVKDAIFNRKSIEEI